MTPYILIGGTWKHVPERSAQVCQAVRQYAPRRARMLICLFSRDPQVWQECFEDLVQIFGTHLDGVTYELAQPDTFMAQLRTADIVYLNDGDNIRMEQAMSRYDPAAVRGAFEGKLIMGSSAGANVLATAYFTRTYGVIRQGLGVLPIKLIAHYDSTPPDAVHPIVWPDVVRQLTEYGDPGMPVRTVEEGKFIVLDRDGQPWGSVPVAVDV